RAERASLVRAHTRRALRWRGLWAGAVACAAAALALVDPDRFRLTLALLVALAVALDIGATLAFQLAVALDRTVWWSFRYPVQNVVLVLATVVLYDRYGLEGGIASIPIASALALVVGVGVVAPSLWSAPGGGELSRDDSRLVRLQWL